MILLDIDDTLLDYTGAERAASAEFGEQFAARIPDYDPDAFPGRWNALMNEYYAEFLAGRLSYLDQRRCRIRAVFKDAAMDDGRADELYSAYKALYEKNWRLFDDVLPFLEKHKDHGFIAVTDGQQAQQERKLARTGIAGYFMAVVTAEGTKSAKPDGKIFREALDAGGLRPEDCAYIGDNLEKDAIGAKDAGMAGVWLNREGVVREHKVIEIRTLGDFTLDRVRY